MSTENPADKLPAPKPQLAFTYNSVDFLFDDRRFIDLTSMWKVAGSPENKSPYRWRRFEGKGFILDLAKSLNGSQKPIIEGTRGKGGSTWAHWQIALAYAKYLSHEFHRLVNEAFREWVEEKADPGLKAERAVEGYIKKGFAPDHALERVEGIIQRKSLCHVLAQHNCKIRGSDNPFAEATRSISLQVLGKTPSEIKEAKGLPKSARTRDYLDKFELIRLRFAESEAERLVLDEASDGNIECVEACRRAGRGVKLALESMSRKTA